MRLMSALRQRLEKALPGASLRGRLAVGAFWSLVGTAITQGLALAASIVSARILGKAGFGELGMILSTVGMFGVFAGLGLGLTATRYIAEVRSQDTMRAGRIVGMCNLVAVFSGGALSIVLFFLAPVLAARTINAPHLTPELQIGCGLLLFNALSGAQRGALAGFEAFKTIAKVNLAGGLLTFPLLIAGVYFWGLRGAVAAQVAAAGVGWLISYVGLGVEAAKAGTRVSYRKAAAELPLLWRFSLPAVLSGSMVGPVRWAANAVLVNQPSGYGEMGIFNAASRFQRLLSFGGQSFGAALLPILSSKDGSTSERFARANILVSWVLGAAGALPFICFPELMRLLYGPEFGGVQAKRTLVLVMVFACIALYKDGLARVLAAEELMWWGVLSNAFWSVTLLGSLLAFVRWGAVGLALSFLVAYALNTVVFIPLYTRRALVPAGTIVSPEAGLVWVSIAGLAALSLLGCSFQIRLLAFLLGAACLLIAFKRLSSARDEA